MIWSIIIIEVLVAGRVIWDHHRIRKGIAINHLVNGLIQLTVCAGTGMACTVGIWSQAVLILFNLALFWLQFDYILNIVRGLHWTYLGSGKGSAVLDKILRNHPYARLAFKLFLAVGFGILFYLT